MSGRLEITTHIGCPINCMDCPQALLKSRYKGRKTLDFEDYIKAIDKVPENVRIDFSGMCEPFVNKRCADMILYAAQKGHPIALYTTLQGATEEDLEKLKDVGYEVVTIHIPDKNGRSFFQVTDEYLALLEKWHADFYSCHGETDERVLDYIDPSVTVITEMHDRAGNVECRPHMALDPNIPMRCIISGKALNHNVLLPDGTVLMCCMDYGMVGVLGNLFEQTYEMVMASDKANDLRMRFDGGESICRHCSNARLI